MMDEIGCLKGIGVGGISLLKVIYLSLRCFDDSDWILKI